MGALKQETVQLRCEVDASPPAETFQWTFNSSGEQTEISPRLHSSEVGIVWLLASLCLCWGTGNVLLCFFMWCSPSLVYMGDAQKWILLSWNEIACFCSFLYASQLTDAKKRKDKSDVHFFFACYLYDVLGLLLSELF